jgi:hypothetical protein
MSTLRGSKAAEKSASSFARTTFFSLKDGEKDLIRFLTDSEPVEVNGKLVGGWITVFQHQNVATKSAPAGFKGNWPGHMTAICRKQDLTELGIPEADDCFLCELNDPNIKLTKRTWALAVQRQEVREGGKIVGYKDVKRDVTQTNPDGSTGATTQEPSIVVINLGYRNFFGPVEGYASLYGTVLDRDFVVKRKGSTTDTVYTPIGLDPIPVDEAGHIFDLRDPEFMARYLPSAETEGYAKASDTLLVPVLADRCSDDYYAKFFDTRVEALVASSNGKAAPVTPAAVAAPDNDLPLPASVDMAALKARIANYDDEAPAEATAAPTPTKVLAL